MTQSIKEKLREIALEIRRKPYPISDFISLLNKAADSLDEKDKMQVEIEKLRQLAATCYAGLGGECNLPEAWLDTLNKAANGEDFSTEGLLPYQNQDAHRINLLINAIGKAAAEAGIYNEQVPMSGHLALMQKKLYKVVRKTYSGYEKSDFYYTNIEIFKEHNPNNIAIGIDESEFIEVDIDSPDIQ